MLTEKIYVFDNRILKRKEYYPKNNVFIKKRVVQGPYFQLQQAFDC